MLFELQLHGIYRALCLAKNISSAQHVFFQKQVFPKKILSMVWTAVTGFWEMMREISGQHTGENLAHLPGDNIPRQIAGTVRQTLSSCYP
jgi:hypothetical protein